MKRIASIIFSVFIFFTLLLPAFAADSANFSIKVESQNDKQAVISINYDGGATFSCLDMEMTVDSAKLSVVNTENGAGLKSFREYAEGSGNAVMPIVNSNSTPVKFSLATTAAYKNVKGTDIFLITLNKKSKSDISKADISLNITNCQTYEGKNVKTTVVSSIAGTVTSAAQTASAAVSDSSQTIQQPQSTSNITSTSVDITVETDGGTLIANDENSSVKTDAAVTKDNKKIIIIGIAALICVILVVTAIIIYSRKKSSTSEINREFTESDEALNNTEDGLLHDELPPAEENKDEVDSGHDE